MQLDAALALQPWEQALAREPEPWALASLAAQVLALASQDELELWALALRALARALRPWEQA